MVYELDEPVGTLSLCCIYLRKISQLAFCQKFLRSRRGGKPRTKQLNDKGKMYLTYHHDLSSSYFTLALNLLFLFDLLCLLLHELTLDGEMFDGYH